MSLRSRVVSQFKRPRGLLGRVAGWILAAREANKQRNAWTVGLLGLKGGERVLEIGCGPGVALAKCLTWPGVTAVGLDHSSVMIAQALKRNRAAVRAGRLQLAVGTPSDLLPAQGSFDTAFSINVIPFVDDEAAFAAQVRSVMKPGGMFATTYQPRHKGATRADAFTLAKRLSDLLQQHGFDGVRVAEIDLKPVPAVCVLAKLRD